MTDPQTLSQALSRNCLGNSPSSHKLVMVLPHAVITTTAGLAAVVAFF